MAAVDDDKIKDITYKFMTKDDKDIGKHKSPAKKHRQSLRKVILKKKLRAKKKHEKQKKKQAKIQKKKSKRLAKMRAKAAKIAKKQGRTVEEVLQDIPDAPQKKQKKEKLRMDEELPKEYQEYEEEPGHDIKSSIFGGKRLSKTEKKEVSKKQEKAEKIKQKKQAEEKKKQDKKKNKEELKEPVKPDAIIEINCAKCGQALRKTSKFCDNCGSDKIMHITKEVNKEKKPKKKRWWKTLLKIIAWTLLGLLILACIAAITYWVLTHYYGYNFTLI